MNIFEDMNLTQEQDAPSDPSQLFRFLVKDGISYLRDVQSEILNKWYEKRNNKDTVIKMNTGAGKTIVGLLALQSSLNEGMKKAVYLTSSNLIDQTVKEAQKMGVKHTKDIKDRDFQRGDAILICSVQTMFNGKSRFGVNQSGVNPDVVLIDDAHAAFETISEQFSMSVPPTTDLYSKIWAIFQTDLLKHYPVETNSIGEHKINDIVRVPFWSIINNKNQLVDLLNQYSSDEKLQFSIPLVNSKIEHYDIILSPNNITFIPTFTRPDDINGFKNAKRRIYMTATFADEATLISDFGLDGNICENIIHPQYASDIGDRLIITSNQFLNGDNIESLIDEITENILIITTSNSKAEEWARKTGGVFYKAGDIQKIPGDNKISIIANKYDGLSLDDDKCRLLIIDGLPTYNNAREKVESKLLGYSHAYKRKISYKVEQGMGRGVRSSEDWCAVIILEEYNQDLLWNAEEFFSNATATQFELSRKVHDQLDSSEEVFKAIDSFMKRDPSWLKISKQSRSSILYESHTSSKEWRVLERQAYELALLQHYNEAIASTREAISKLNDLSDPYMNGLLQERLSKYQFLKNDKSASLKTLKGAQKCNYNVSRPWIADAYSSKEQEQASAILERLKVTSKHKVNKVLKDLDFKLVFKSSTAAQFESGLKEVGDLLGFVSRRPEKDEELGTTLDVMWKLNKDILILPCKTKVVSDKEVISKSDADKTLGDIDWAKSIVEPEGIIYNALVHPYNKLDELANIREEHSLRVINQDYILKIHKKIKQLYTDILSDENNSESEVARLIKEYGLSLESIHNNALNLDR